MAIIPSQCRSDGLDEEEGADLVWRLLGFLRPYWRHVVGLFAALILVAALNIAEPALMGKLTSAIFTGGRGLAVPRLFGGNAAPIKERDESLEFLFRKEGGFRPRDITLIKQASQGYLTGFGRTQWRETNRELLVRLQVLPGKRLPQSAIGEELALRAAQAVPGTKLYPRLSTRQESGLILFPALPTVYLVPVVLLVVLLLKAGVVFAQVYMGSIATGGAVRDIRNALFAHLHRLSLGFFERQQTGQLMSRITNDVGAVHLFMHHISADVLADLLTVGAGVAYAFISIDWLLALVTVVAMVLIAWPVERVGRILRGIGRAIQGRWADLSSTLQETIAGVRVIKAFQLEGLASRWFDRESEHIYRTTLRSARLAGALTPSIEFLAGLVVSVFIWFGAHQVGIGRLSPDQLFTFIFLVGFIANPVKRLSRIYGQVQQAIAAAERVFELMDEDPQVKDAPEAITLPPVHGQVSFEGVSFAYDQGPLVLTDINLDVEPGEVLALVGPSGAGKTSLVNLIPRFYDPAAGRILVDGHDLRSVTIDSLRMQMGIVPQETLLFRATMAENIGFGRPGANMEEIIQAAKSANAHAFISAMPDGYETMVGERGETLSGGQRQRIAIARAILRDPRILILDEATSALDSESEALVQEALERLMVGRTTFVIAHRLSTVRRATRLAVFTEGRLVELGTHDELIHLGGVYTRLYERQFCGVEG